MEKNERKMPLSMTSLDDLFSTQEQRDNADLEKVIDIELDKIKPFPNHPFKVVDNQEMEDKVIKFYPNEIKRIETRVDNIIKDVDHLKENTKAIEGFQGMILNGKNYIEKAEAGQQIIDICKSMTNTEPKEIGEYRGFKMILSFDSFDRKFHLGMKKNLSYDVELGSDVHGNITRIDNVLNGIESKIEYTKNNLEDTKKQYENAKQEINRPFPQEEELKIKTKRLDELNILLNLNEKDKEIIADGNDEILDSQVCKREYER